MKKSFPALLALAALLSISIIPALAEYKMPGLRGDIVSSDGTVYATTASEKNLVLGWPAADEATADTDIIHWMRGRLDSPWYPTLRLFRQPARGDWPAVFGRMADALRDTLASSCAGSSPQCFCV